MRLLLFAMLCVGCNRQNFVELVPFELGEGPTTGSGGPAGFTCRVQCPCSDGSSQCSYLLFERAANAARTGPTGLGLNPDFAGTHAIGSAIVDLLSLGPGPSDSDPFVVIMRCSQKNVPCVPIVRQCFPIDLTLARDVVDASGPTAGGVLLSDIFTQLHQSGALLSADAPDDELLVRMVTTTLSCDQIAQLPLGLSRWPADAPDKKWGESIFGCGYAGPLHLDAQQGDLFLGLPTLDAVNCVPQAAVCAADFNPQYAGALLGF